MLVQRFSTSLHSPEDVIVKQGEPNDSMYFISTGDCAVNITDHKNEEHIAYKLLVEGDHFGELSLLYGCNAQASIVSMSYDNLALLPRRGFIDTIDKFPHFEDVVRKYSYKYTDKKKLFMLRLIKSVEYFSKENNEMHHRLMYKLKTVLLEEGTLVLRVGDATDKIIFVERG